MPEPSAPLLRVTVSTTMRAVRTRSTGTVLLLPMAIPHGHAQQRCYMIRASDAWFGVIRTSYNPPMRVIGIAGWSGAGKTTLLARMIPCLVARGVRVSTVKPAHHSFDRDPPG